jgi:DNA-binding MarR family transcriptional regulator
VGALHRALAHKRSTLTSILDRLVERGLVTREVAEQDRRAFMVRLTRRGSALATRVYERLEAVERAAIGDARSSAASDALALLAALERAAESAPQPARQPARAKRARARASRPG